MGLPTVGFIQSSSTQDETSGAISIEVQLSEPAAGLVTVHYALGGTATEGPDYTSAADTLTFSPGDTTKTIELTISPDGVDEPDETIELTLDSPTGAALATAQHTVTISANALPRVVLSTATSSLDEEMPVMITFSLTSAAAGPVTVKYTVGGGTALGSGTYADYGLASGEVTFPAGSTSQQLPLNVLTDTRNENNETVDITLTSSMGAVVGTTAMQRHTILDNDPVPTAAITTSSPTLTLQENVAAVMVTVALSDASGKTVDIPWTIAGTSTATLVTDYTVSNSTMTLSFPEGTTSQTITVNVVQDTLDETDETVVVNLGTPVNATLGAVADRTRTITIQDDDLWCQGTGAFAVCYDAGPTAAVVLTNTINTTSSSLCGAQPVGWSAQGQPAACVIVGTSITMPASTTVTGARPLVLAATTAINISGILDVSSRLGGSAGPASPSGSCRAFPQAPEGGDGGGAGGAGGSFMSKGGNGGVGASINQEGTSPISEAARPTALRAGCHGQQGAGSGGNNSGAVGRGGGAVMLAAGGTITISGAINASGSGGEGGSDETGGSGAGTGGMIYLHAAAFSASGGVVMANGGGGAGGGRNGSSGTDGTDPLTTAPLVRAPGGSNQAGGGGGQGHGGTTGPGAGESVGNNRGGGGGGGGGGYIRANLALTGASVSAGLVEAP
ncbi:MAG: retention module-containing protein [Myxococcales bacterium]|nr:retention module-containing protein [Myxococcales bacterium]